VAKSVGVARNRSLSSLLGVLGDLGALGDLAGAGLMSASSLFAFFPSLVISEVSKDSVSCKDRYDGVPGCGERKKAPGDLNAASSRFGKLWN
jgi:hypothetical protein